MKHKFLKTFFTLVLAGTLAVSGVCSNWTGMENVEAAKIVAPTTLGQVTGIRYDVKTEKITWNKVVGATEYVITLKDSEGYSYSYDWGTSNLYISKGTFEGENWINEAGKKKYVSSLNGAYSVSIVARDRESYYVVQSKGDTSYYDSVNKKYIYLKYPAGPAGTAVIQVEAERKKVTNSITALPGIVLKEVQEGYVCFKAVGSFKLNLNESISFEYSNNAAFQSNSAKGFYSGRTSTSDENAIVRVPLSPFAPGDTVYVRARVYNGEYRLPNQSYTYSSDKYGAYTKTVTYSVPKAKIGNVRNVAEPDKIALTANLKEGTATGYQFAKKVKSGWVTLGTQTSNTYIDKGLNKNTKYQYRVRSYYYNKYTKKTIWSDWYTTEAVTWGAAMNLKAEAAGATSAKLSWKPVAGAEGYEIYRYDMESASNTTEKGQGLEFHSTGTLVKSVKNKKLKSYTDKKLIKGQSYTYVVRAYRTIDKKKCYIEDQANVYLKAKNLNVISQYYMASGSKTVTWQKMTGIKGYYVERYDKVTKQYTTISTLKAKAASYTFPKQDIGSDSVQYRIRPFDGTTIYDGSSFLVEPSLATVKNVKAVRSNNGIQVSWQPVAGAEYYYVYRTTDSGLNYNKTTKTYSCKGEMIYEAALNTAGCQPELGKRDYNSYGTYRTYKIKGTSVRDATLTYKTTAEDAKGDYIKIGKTPDGKTLYQTEEVIYNEGPEPGNNYYYYVVAVARAANGSYDYSTVTSIGCTKPASVNYTNAVAKKVSKITSVSSKKKGKVTVKYKKVSGVDGYAIYRSTKKKGTYTMVGTSTKTSFTDASAQSGKTYYYKVASYVKGEAKANVYSAKTAAKKVKVK